MESSVSTGRCGGGAARRHPTVPRLLTSRSASSTSSHGIVRPDPPSVVDARRPLLHGGEGVGFACTGCGSHEGGEEGKEDTRRHRPGRATPAKTPRRRPPAETLTPAQTASPVLPRPWAFSNKACLNFKIYDGRAVD